MPDYEELYYQMVRASERAIRTLIQAQRDCEEALLREADEEDHPPQSSPIRHFRGPAPRK